MTTDAKVKFRYATIIGGYLNEVDIIESSQITDKTKRLLKSELYKMIDEVRSKMLKEVIENAEVVFKYGKDEDKYELLQSSADLRLRAFE